MMELEWWLNGTTKHSTAGKTAIASGSGAGSVPDNLFDGNLTTWWYSGGGTGWVGTDFGVGNAVQVGMIAAMGRWDASQWPITWLHEYSISDGTTWVASGIGGDTAGMLGINKKFYFTDPAGGFKHIRLRWISDASGAVRLSAVETRLLAGGADVSNTAIAKISQADTVGTYVDLFDGNASTEWASNAFPAFVLIYFPNNRSIGEVMLQAPVTNITQAPDHLYVDVTLDGIVFYNILSQLTLAAWSASEIRTFSLSGTSYDYPGGKGNRTATVTITTDAVAGQGTVSMLVNGTYNNEYWWSGSQTLRSLKADFGVGASKVCDEYTWNQDVGVHHGAWKAGGSNDGVTITLFPETFNLGDANGGDIIPFTNSTGYRYYHLVQQVGAVTVTTPYIREWEFKLRDAV